MHLGKYRSLQLDSNRWSLTTTCAHTSKKGLSTGAREAETFLGKFKEKKAENDLGIQNVDSERWMWCVRKGERAA